MGNDCLKMLAQIVLPPKFLIILQSPEYRKQQLQPIFLVSHICERREMRGKMMAKQSLQIAAGGASATAGHCLTAISG